MKRINIKPQVKLEIVQIESSIANGSNRDCNGRPKGNGHGNGKGCKVWDSIAIGEEFMDDEIY